MYQLIKQEERRETVCGSICSNPWSPASGRRQPFLSRHRMSPVGVGGAKGGTLDGPKIDCHSANAVLHTTAQAKRLPKSCKNVFSLSIAAFRAADHMAARWYHHSSILFSLLYHSTQPKVAPQNAAFLSSVPQPYPEQKGDFLWRVFLVESILNKVQARREKTLSLIHI